MVSQPTHIAVFFLFTTASASYPSIAGYEPGSDVTQHNRIDLDQKEMEEWLKKVPPNFPVAKAIYENGAHSGAYARLTVAATDAALTKGATATQSGNAAATGSVKKDKGAGATEVDVTYTSTCVDNAQSKDYSTSGCYNTAGVITVAGQISIGAPNNVDNKYRTLAGFSTAAGAKMAGQVTFEKYKTYYGHPDYGHRYVTAALDGNGIFTGQDDAARVEGAKKGSAYMNVWMYVIREMEDAVVDCKAGCIDCNDDPVHAWDEAVAFYTGTLEGQTSNAGTGTLLYALADKRCQNFKTCAGGTATGLSSVNTDIMVQFALGRSKLQAGECTKVPAIRDIIITKMIVPLIQGSLRYAYKVDKLQGGSKEKAEGAVFSAAIVPMIAHCDSAKAKIIADNMAIDESNKMKDGFAAVKAAFEDTYSCLGITCADVGGLLLTSDYYEGAEPCSKASEVSEGKDSVSRASYQGGKEVLFIGVTVYIMSFLAMP